MLPGLVLAVFLLAHALIHVSFLAPRPVATAGAPDWPFDPETSWLLAALRLPPDRGRLLAMALVAATIGGFALAAVASLGLTTTGVWQAAVAIGAFASLVSLIVFLKPWLSLGLAIDLGLLWAVLIVGWAPMAASLP